MRFVLRMQRLSNIRVLVLGAVCALGVACLSTVAQARPQSSSTSASKTGKNSSIKKHAATKKSATKNRKISSATAHRILTPAAEKSSASTQTKSKTTGAKGKRSRRHRVRGQQKIDSERAQQIQEALIREHYLTGEATGTWNQATEQAMRHYQADQGWQTKTVPDSRALIKLGLGPSNDHLLNPESAMTSSANAPKAASLTPSSHSAGPAAASKTPAADPVSPTGAQQTSRPQ